MKPYLLYGAGDPGTRSLLSLFNEKGVRVDFRDIRHTDAQGERRFLMHLSERNLRTVPQVFDPNGNHLGGYDETALMLSAIPTPNKSKITA